MRQTAKKSLKVIYIYIFSQVPQLGTKVLIQLKLWPSLHSNVFKYWILVPELIVLVFLLVVGRQRNKKINPTLPHPQKKV